MRDQQGNGWERGGAMTRPDAPETDDAKDPDTDPSPGDGVPGVEIGLSDGAGGTFEPEEDPDDADGLST
jgi:hypothetical protein